MILLMVRLFLISNHIYICTHRDTLVRRRKAHADIYLQLLPKYVRNQTIVLRRRRYISKTNVRLSHLFGCTKKRLKKTSTLMNEEEEKRSFFDKGKAKRQITDPEKEGASC